MQSNYTIKQTLNPWTYRADPIPEFCFNNVSVLAIAGEVGRSKVGVQEYISEDPANPKIYKVEDLSISYNLTVGTSVDITCTYSESKVYNPKVGGSIIVDQTGMFDNGSVTHATVELNTTTGQYQWKYNPPYGSNTWFYPPYVFPIIYGGSYSSFPIGSLIDGANGYGGNTGHTWTVTTYTKTSTSITIVGDFVNSYGASGSITITWTLSEEFTDLELEGQVDELLAAIDLDTAPFNDYEGLYGGYPNIKVVASYGGGGNPTTWSTAVSAATTALASANAALTTATNNQATKDAAVTTARGQRDTAQALFDTAATAYNDGQLEYFKALINLDTWTMRKNAEQITAAKARVDLDFERAFRWDSLIQTNYWDKMESLQNKEWLLRYAIQYAADNHLIVAVLTYQVARKTFELAIATANQTAAAIDGEQIILSVSDSGVWDAFATYQKGGTGLTKRKIKYKLRVEVEYSPRSTDNDLTFYWREATIVDKVPTFSDKTESVSIAESDPYAVLESHWHRLGWSSFYNIAAPSTNSDIKVVGLPIKSTLSLINQDSRGCIEQKLGFPEYTNQSTPPKVYMTETVAGTLSSDGSQFIYLTDYSEWYYDYSWAWNLIPITRSYNTYNSDKVEDEFRIPAKEITQTTRIYSDDSTLTLSDEFSTEYLKSLVDPVYNTPFGEWSDALDYIAYTGITITTDIQAYYIFPEDESVYGRRKYLFQLRGTLPASYGATDGGEDFDFTYSIFTRDLTTGVITEDEQDLTLTIINNSFATTGDGSEEEYAGYITIEATDRNTVKWIGKLMGGDNPRFWDKPICV